MTAKAKRTSIISAIRFIAPVIFLFAVVLVKEWNAGKQERDSGESAMLPNVLVREEESSAQEQLQGVIVLTKESNTHEYLPNNDVSAPISVLGGHWEYSNKVAAPYQFLPEVCDKSYLHKGDCIKTISCPKTLMNWQYVTANNGPYPKFDVKGFRSKMRNKRIVFVGDSTARQQVQALVWTLGHTRVKWEHTKSNSCSTNRLCMTDKPGNITICYQTMGSMSTKIYREGDYTFDHSLRNSKGDTGDSSCLLYGKLTNELAGYDLVLVQGITWWLGLPRVLNSTTSPYEWLSKIVPTVYKDAIGKLLANLADRTKTVLVLGQVGTACGNKTAPEEFDPANIPDDYGWSLAPEMWHTLLDYLDEMKMNVQIVDARDPVMQSVHAHPLVPGGPYNNTPECLHFCMNSAAVNIYLDMYWNEIFSRYVEGVYQE
jgi:hypothetical protein